jgi:hypothetical protein
MTGVAAWPGNGLASGMHEGPGGLCPVPARSAAP